MVGHAIAIGIAGGDRNIGGQVAGSPGRVVVGRTRQDIHTEYLLTHASQYYLVNLTAQQIIENITYARKGHVALPYLGKKIDDELWREWVLPQRVLEEDLSL